LRTLRFHHLGLGLACVPCGSEAPNDQDSKSSLRTLRFNLPGLGFACVPCGCQSTKSTKTPSLPCVPCGSGSTQLTETLRVILTYPRVRGGGGVLNERRLLGVILPYRTVINQPNPPRSYTYEFHSVERPYTNLTPPRVVLTYPKAREVPNQPRLPGLSLRTL